MPDGRVLIAGGNPLVPSPSWTRYDELTNCRCSGWELTTGRSSVFERTDVGSATVSFHDRAGVLDEDELVGRPIQLQIRNPLTGVWEPSFRGVIDEVEATVSGSAYPAHLANVQLNCVDLFAYLSRVEFVLGEGMGDGLVGEAARLYAGKVVYLSERVDDRITALLEDAMVPEELYVVFTGNVNVWFQAYDPGDSLVNAIRDAADAEFPGVANVYVDRRGRVCFHGRESRFDPDGTASGADWDFERWAGGDSAAIEADPTRAQVRAFAFTRASSLIYNAAIAWPKWIPNPSGEANTEWGVEVREFPEKFKEAQWSTDTASITANGYRAMPPMGDLIIRNNFNNGNSGTLETQKMAQYFVQNYAAVQKSIRACTFKAIHPDDARASATWDLLTRIDISDILNLTIAAGGVTDEEYFVEGLTKTVSVLQPDFDYVEVSPNLTPVARYVVDPF
jgi:hypothetical protein